MAKRTPVKKCGFRWPIPVGEAECQLPAGHKYDHCYEHPVGDDEVRVIYHCIFYETTMPARNARPPWERKERGW